MGTTLDYAGAEFGRRWRFSPTRRTWVALIVLASVVAVCSVAVRVHRYRVLAASLTRLGEVKQSYEDGRDAQILIAGNENRRTSVVLVLHYGTVDPSRREAVCGRVYSTDDPIEGLLSSARLTTSWPPDPKVSGLWVDGRRRAVSDRLTVVYISDKVRATDVAVGEEEQEAFLKDAGKLDPLVFIEKWIKPRLPGAKPAR